MAIDYHLKIGSIKGESAHDKHKEEIKLLAWNWGVTNHTTIVGQGMSAGKVSVSDLTITKNVDASSPKLLELCSTGKHVDEAILSCCKSTGATTTQDFFIIKMKEVYVTSYQIGGAAGEDVGAETISLTCGYIHHDYKKQDKAGTLTSAATFGLNVISGTSG